MRNFDRRSDLLLLTAIAITVCSSSILAKPVGSDPQQLRTQAKELLAPLPEVMPSDKHPITPAKVKLGQMLYFDTRLSRGQEISCASCHDLNGYGVDTRLQSIVKGRSLGHRQQFGPRNSPSTYNAALQIAQFWDGRADDVEEQAKGPILNPIEMTMADEGSVVAVLNSIPDYAGLFKAAFPESASPVSYNNMAEAIGAYERTLVTPGRFDKFLKGDDAALGPDEREGLAVFLERGCVACHQGPGVGGTMFEKLGLFKPYPTDDEGRAAVTKSASDKHVFKVPMLRNVAKTAPYFHDGSISSLQQAVAVMAEYQTPDGKLDDTQIKHLEAFLNSLTGDLPTSKIGKPQLPPNGPHTPAGDPNWVPAAPASTEKAPAPK